MASIPHTKFETNITNIEHYIWESMASGDEGVSFKFAKPTDKTYHVYGDFDGAVVTMYGSNDPRADADHADHASASWFVLKNTGGDSIALSSVSGGVVAENPMWMRPVVSGGGAGVSLNMAIVAKRVF